MFRWTRRTLGFALFAIAALLVVGCGSAAEDATTLDSSVSTISLKIEGMT